MQIFFNPNVQAIFCNKCITLKQITNCNANCQEFLSRKDVSVNLSISDVNESDVFSFGLLLLMCQILFDKKNWLGLELLGQSCLFAFISDSRPCIICAIHMYHFQTSSMFYHLSLSLSPSLHTHTHWCSLPYSHSLTSFQFYEFFIRLPFRL